jgi:hypothetical protein
MQSGERTPFDISAVSFYRPSTFRTAEHWLTPLAPVLGAWTCPRDVARGTAYTHAQRLRRRGTNIISSFRSGIANGTYLSLTQDRDRPTGPVRSHP